MRTNKNDANRADEVRHRRTKRTQEKAKRAVKQVRYASEAPVVFARGGFGTPVLRRTQSKVKRKVAIPLSSGAELQMPALPMVQPGWRLLSFFLVCLLSFAIYTAVTSPAFVVHEPEIFGIQRLTVNDIDVIAEIAGTPIFMVDPAGATENLKAAFPELSSVSVKIILPTAVVIDVVERIPVVAWHYDQQTLWIDAEGAIFPARGQPLEPLIAISADIPPPLLPKALPVKSDKDGEEAESIENNLPDGALGSMVGRRVDPKMMEGIQVLSHSLPTDTILVYEKLHGMGWSDPAGWNVFIGRNLDDLHIKMAVYERLVEKINQEDVLPSIVSVAQVHAPYYRWEQ
jgi:hypothetical protein